MSFAYVGSSTDSVGLTTGISMYAVDESTGALEFRQRVDHVGASFLAVSPKRSVLYAPSHSPRTFGGDPGSTVAAYRLEPGSGRMERFDVLDLPIANALHACLDRE